MSVVSGREEAKNIPDMSVNLFNRLELGLGPGSIEVLDLSHGSMRDRITGVTSVAHLFLNRFLESLQLFDDLSAIELVVRLLVADLVELLLDL